MELGQASGLRVPGATSALAGQEQPETHADACTEEERAAHPILKLDGEVRSRIAAEVPRRRIVVCPCGSGQPARRLEGDICDGLLPVFRRTSAAA